MNSPQEFTRLAAGVRALQSERFRGGAALATLIGIDGAAFRRPGARMLVRGDGRQIRGLSVGCAEADLIARAAEVIDTGRATLVEYDREQGLDLLLEIGCGVALRTLIEPLDADSRLDWIEGTSTLLDARGEGLLITAYARDGQCLHRPRRLLWSDDILLDELGDRALSAALTPWLQRSTLQRPASRRSVQSGEASWQLFVEPLHPPLQAVIVGDNPTARALAALAAQLGWTGLQLVESAADAGSDAPLPRVASRPGELPGELVLDQRTAAVVMTHNLERDIAVLKRLSEQPLAYLGATASRGRAEKLRQGTGLGAEQLHAPAGLDIRAETPEEIALAIAAEIQASFAGRGGQPLHVSEGPLH